MTVREHGDHRIGTTTRRLAILGVAWAAAGAAVLAGCSQPTVTSNASAAGAVAVTATATETPASTSPEPAPLPAAALVTPVRIIVPSIGVDAPLVELGLTPDGALDVPTTAMAAGWYTGSPVPGRNGPAVIAGHVHWSGVPGVFAHLADLAPGDRITVTRSDGTTATFSVDRVATYAKARFPTAEVYGPLDFAGLRLITCGGFDSEARAYQANVIVFASLATP